MNSILFPSSPAGAADYYPKNVSWNSPDQPDLRLSPFDEVC
ncbi:hypothetical protein [Candidatus Chlorohelix sp.]